MKKLLLIMGAMVLLFGCSSTSGGSNGGTSDSTITKTCNYVGEEGYDQDFVVKSDATGKYLASYALIQRREAEIDFTEEDIEKIIENIKVEVNESIKDAIDYEIEVDGYEAGSTVTLISTFYINEDTILSLAEANQLPVDDTTREQIINGEMTQIDFETALEEFYGLEDYKCEE